MSHPSSPATSPSAENSSRKVNPEPPWETIAAGAGFQRLLRTKTRFIAGATVFFLLYYFALPISTGYWPELMGRKVLGEFSLAYVFALTQFPMAWLVAALYLRAASGFDRQAAAILASQRQTPASKSSEVEAK